MANRFLLGIDVGSSSVKTSLVNADTGKCVAAAFYPEKEAPIMAVKAGWAEQDPQTLILKGLTLTLGSAWRPGGNALTTPRATHSRLCFPRDHGACLWSWKSSCGRWAAALAPYL